MIVVASKAWGDTGDCGRRGSAAAGEGVCVFCGDCTDHECYALAEASAGRAHLAYWAGDDPAHGGRCPLYRLHLDDPLPPLHEESVVSFNPTVGHPAYASRRLASELVAILIDARRASGTAQPGELYRYVIDACEVGADQTLAELAEHSDRAALTTMLLVICDCLLELGDVDDIFEWVDGLLGHDPPAALEQIWEQTEPLNRPLLAARRLVRRPLNPAAPAELDRQRSI